MNSFWKKCIESLNLIKKTWLKQYIDMNTELRKMQKMILKNIFSIWIMNNTVFGKTLENMRRHRDIKLVTTKARRNYLLLESNYHTRKIFSENLLAIEMKRYLWINKSTYAYQY